MELLQYGSTRVWGGDLGGICRGGICHACVTVTRKVDSGLGRGLRVRVRIRVTVRVTDRVKVTVRVMVSGIENVLFGDSG